MGTPRDKEEKNAEKYGKLRTLCKFAENARKWGDFL